MLSEHALRHGVPQRKQDESRRDTDSYSNQEEQRGHIPLLQRERIDCSKQERREYFCKFSVRSDHSEGRSLTRCVDQLGEQRVNHRPSKKRKSVDDGPRVQNKRAFMEYREFWNRYRSE